MSEHTPTPWMMAPPYLDIIYGPELCVLCRAPNSPENGKNWEADAAFIVKAVNSHDVLFECLQSIAEMSDQEPREPDDADWRFRCLSAIEVAKRVIALVGGSHE